MSNPLRPALTLAAIALPLVLSILVLSILVAPTAVAQMPPGFDPNEMMRQMQNPEAMKKMEAMAAEAEKAQRCMADIDRNQLEALKKRAESASKEIESLCAAGKKAEALRKGLSLSRELNDNPTVQKMRACSKGMTEAMKDMPWAQMNQMRGLEDTKEPTEGDICS